jgi:23S rRNA G2445 N2-methylase RlmL
MGDLLRRNNATTNSIQILDPTCGSGTFLALALMTWGNASRVDVTGIDSNPKCAHGTVQNLRHLFHHAIDEDCDNDGNNRWTLTLDSNTKISSRVNIYSEDSTRLPSFIQQKFDCAVANLPWNRNTFEFQGRNSTIDCTNSVILRATAAMLKPGSPVLVISGRDEDYESGLSFNARACLQNLGFHVLGEATVPPKGYELPASGKKRSGSPAFVAKKKRVSRSSDCTITIAVVP